MVLNVQPQWIRSFPEEEAPRTGEGLFPGEVVEIVQVICFSVLFSFFLGRSALLLPRALSLPRLAYDDPINLSIINPGGDCSEPWRSSSNEGAFNLSNLTHSFSCEVPGSSPQHPHQASSEGQVQVGKGPFFEVKTHFSSVMCSVQALKSRRLERKGPA
ncbi:unnamed protein product [Ectocarpus sp. 12 AP-2014]